MGQSGAVAPDPGDPPPPPNPAASPPGSAEPERSWRGLTVGLAGGIALVLLLIAVLIATKGDGKPAAQQSSTTTTTGLDPTTSASSSPRQTAASTPTTRKPTPLPIVAADERRVVVLDQSGVAPPRILFDLGPSAPSDLTPPIIGGASLSPDAGQAYFDVVGTPPVGSLRRVPVGGGTPAEIGVGVSPSPSPDGSLLALIQTPEPDVASLVLRPVPAGPERRIDLGDGTCGNIAWAPSRQEIAVDICPGGEPSTVVIIDVATAGLRRLAPPEGVTWSVPAFKPDGTLTLVEQRGPDAVVVSLTPDRTRVAASILRRASTSILTIDWSSAGDLVVCDTDGIMVAAIGGGPPQQVTTGFSSAVW